MGNIIGSDVQENTERVKRILSLSSFSLNSDIYNNNSNSKSKSNSNSNSISEEDNNVKTYNQNAKKATYESSVNNILGGYRKKKSRSKKGVKYKKKRLNKKK